MLNDKYDEKVDVYSFAICLIAMIRAEDTVVRFFFEGLRKVMKKKTLTGIGVTILNNRLHNRAFRPKLPEMLYPSLAKLITDCWSAKGDDRPSFTEIVARLRGEITMEIMLEKEPVMHSIEDGIDSDNNNESEELAASTSTMNFDELRERIETLEDKLKEGENEIETLRSRLEEKVKGSAVHMQVEKREE